jgi:hypothetical protein
LIAALGGGVELMAPGSRSNDGKVSADKCRSRLPHALVQLSLGRAPANHARMRLRLDLNQPQF